MAEASSSASSRVTAGDDEEARLLETVGGTVESMETYESSVLKQATLDTAPKLTGIGFPTNSLESVLPSYNAKTGRADSSAADLPHVKTILSRTRSALAAATNEGNLEPSSKAIDILRLKEQMLLSYLMTQLPPDERPSHPIREAAMEQKRRSALLAPSAKEQESNITTGTEHSVSSSSATASFGKQALLERQQRITRKRTSIMERKQLRAEQNQEDDDDATERKELLRQRWQQRQERKRKRRKQWEEDAGSDDSEEAEMQFAEDDGEHQQQNGGKTEQVINDEEKMEFDQGNIVQKDDSGGIAETESSDQATAKSVMCPICQQPVWIDPELSDVDLVLSQHIDECQRHGERRARRGRTQTISRTEGGSPICDTLAQAGTKSLKPRAKRKRPSARRRPRAERSKPALDDMEEWQYEDRVDKWIESGLDSMRDMTERDLTESPPGAEIYEGGLIIPAWVNDRLFPYQRTGLQWMWELHRQEAGGIVGDEMGLGKTVQVCAYLGAMAACRKVGSMLIVSPATMMQHWLNELKTWAPGVRRILIHKSGEEDGLSRNVSPKLLRLLDKWLRKARADRVNEPIDDRDYDEMDENNFCGTGYVVVTTYESLRRSPDTWTGHAWDYAILDEGQKIRNPDADVTLTCKRLRTPHRLLLSGTPIQNDLRELWSLFDFVFPGRLGTLPAFEAEFSDPIRRGGYSNASSTQVQLAYRVALVLRDLINPYLLRRQKKDIREVSRMPGKTEQVLFCRLSKRQRALYEAYLRSDEVINILRGSTQLFRSICNLRKICNHPDLVCGPEQAAFDSFVRNGYVNESDMDPSSDDEDHFVEEEEESVVERSGKLEVLAKILPLWRKQGHRVLIFCQWKKMLNIIQRFVNNQGWKFSRLDGNTSVASRQHLVDTFNNDTSYFGMLLTTRTGGVGLNLTGADRIILYDPDWNPQTDAQARERAWRFGQKNAVTVYRLITAGTIEEKIYQRQIFKTAISKKVLEDPRQRRLFSQRDLRDLFSLKADLGSISKGGYAVTETGQITKGGGVIDSDEPGVGSSSAVGATSQDDSSTLENVMKSKGLAGVFDHDFVDDPGSQKRASQIEMEEQAKRVARDAAQALRQSSASRDQFQPTWTGSSKTEPRRFGGVKRAFLGIESKLTEERVDGVAAGNNFGAASSAGVARSSSGLEVSSGDLLSHLRQKRSQVTNSADSPGANEATRKYADLLKKLHNFVKQHGGHRIGGGPTTDDILQAFNSVPNCDAAVFRRLLNSIAVVRGGRWRLKNET